jgi:glutathione S-transferase
VIFGGAPHGGPFPSGVTKNMKLYFSPGACSFASHVVLRELALPFDLVQVDLVKKTTKAGADFWAVNPKGYVPALELDDGGAVLTEGPAILQYLADLKPESKLAPANGTLERYRLQEWLGFINSEVHKSFSPLFNPAASADTKEGAKKLLARRLAWVEKEIAGRDFLTGSTFTVADAYLYTVLGWAGYVGLDLQPYANLQAFQKRVAARPAVQAAHAAEKG